MSPLMKTVLQTIQSGTPYLEKAGVESARLNMEMLAHVMGCKRMHLYLRFDRPLEEAILEPLRDLTRRRANANPSSTCSAPSNSWAASSNVMPAP